jgi:hypothetical protein
MGYSNCNPCDPCGTNQNAAKAAAYARQANTYATNAENSWLEFNALYLGAFAVAPTVDNEGEPLQVGALYWNTGDNELYVWNGIVWVQTNDFDEFTPFLATGTTTPRNLVTRFADVVNVLDFIPASEHAAIKARTSTYDATADIQAALNAASTRIYFPSGIYNITSELTITRNSLYIFGDRSYFYGSVISSESPNINIFNISGFGLKFENLWIRGFERDIPPGQPYTSGENTTCTGMLFSRPSKDLDAEVKECTFTNLHTGIKATGTNFIAARNSFGATLFSLDFYQYLTEEMRGFRVENNRFHTCGSNLTDPSSTNSTCITMNGTLAKMNQIINNYADGCRKFYKGPLGIGTLINDNNITRSRGTGITITETTWNQEWQSGMISNNIIESHTPDYDSTEGGGIYLDSVKEVIVSNNVICFVREHGIFLQNCLNVHVIGNLIKNININSSVDGSIYDGIHIDSDSIFNFISSNKIRRSIPESPRYGIYVAGNQNVFEDNTSQNITTPFYIEPLTNIAAYGDTRSSFNKRRVEYLNNQPLTGRWLIGDIVWNTSPVAGGTAGWICTASGTPGTWKTFGSISA